MTTHKWMITLSGFRPCYRGFILEVPADWDEDDIKSLNANDLAVLTHDIEWEQVDTSTESVEPDEIDFCEEGLTI